jgi:hypothetical protein
LQSAGGTRGKKFPYIMRCRRMLLLYNRDDFWSGLKDGIIRGYHPDSSMKVTVHQFTLHTFTQRFRTVIISGSFKRPRTVNKGLQLAENVLSLREISNILFAERRKRDTELLIFRSRNQRQRSKGEKFHPISKRIRV